VQVQDEGGRRRRRRRRIGIIVDVVS